MKPAGVEIAKCPDCGEILTPGRYCDCGHYAKPITHKPFRPAAQRLLPNRFQKELDEGLRRVGLDRKQGESTAEHASRCRRYVIERFGRNKMFTAIVDKAKEDESATPF